MKAICLVVATVIASFHGSVAQSQSAAGYPTRLVRIIVAVAAGGNNDLVARAIAQQLTEGLGQQVLVENRPSASSLVGIQFVGKSAPDGYTLLHTANTFPTLPSVIANPGYDPVKDFTGVTMTCQVPKIVVVNPALPVHSVKELIALAKSRPGDLSYASSGLGSTGHMAVEQFSRQAAIRMLHVPYKGNAQAITDVIGGHVMMIFDEVSTSIPHIRSGKLRGLAVASRTRSPIFPTIPTVDESGLPGYEAITFTGLMAPAGIPREILARLHAEVVKAVRAPEPRKQFLQLGVELAASASPEAFTAYIKSEVERTAKLAREVGLKLE